MSSVLPPSPDLGHLREEARALLRALRAARPDALRRASAHAASLPPVLATAQLVVAREYGFESWTQLRSLVIRMSSGGVRYDTIGRGYAEHRRADPRIAAAVTAALGNARTVVNVGAGTGSYEPTDRPVVPVDPSTAMALQRDPSMPPTVLGVAESLPMADKTADAALGVLTMHHWSDVRRGLAELVRVARRRIVLVTIDTDVEQEVWILRDYMPEVVEQDRREFPSMALLAECLPGPPRISPLPVPGDCTDGFLIAYWNRPEALLDPAVRAATSGFARMDAARTDTVTGRLADDLDSGRWDEAYGHLRAQSVLDVGLRLVVAELA